MSQHKLKDHAMFSYVLDKDFVKDKEINKLYNAVHAGHNAGKDPIKDKEHNKNVSNFFGQIEKQLKHQEKERAARIKEEERLKKKLADKKALEKLING